MGCGVSLAKDDMGDNIQAIKYTSNKSDDSEPKEIDEGDKMSGREATSIKMDLETFLFLRKIMIQWNAVHKFVQNKETYSSKEAIIKSVEEFINSQETSMLEHLQKEFHVYGKSEFSSNAQILEIFKSSVAFSILQQMIKLEYLTKGESFSLFAKRFCKCFDSIKLRKDPGDNPEKLEVSAWSKSYLILFGRPFLVPFSMEYSKVIKEEPLSEADYCLDFENQSEPLGMKEQMVRVEISCMKDCRAVLLLEEDNQAKQKTAGEKMFNLSSEELTSKVSCRFLQFKLNNYSHKIPLILPKSNITYSMTFAVLSQNEASVADNSHISMSSQVTSAKIVKLYTLNIQGRFDSPLPVSNPRMLRFQADYELLSPLTGILPVREQFRFKLIVEAAVRVFVYEPSRPLPRLNSTYFAFKTPLIPLQSTYHGAKKMYSRRVNIGYEGTVQVIAQLKDSYKYVRLCEFRSKLIEQTIISRLLGTYLDKGNKEVTDVVWQAGVPNFNPEFLERSLHVQQSASLEEICSSVRQIRCQSKDCNQRPDHESMSSGCFSCSHARVASIYNWIACNISYDSQGSRLQTTESPREVIAKRKTVCRGFSSLFHYLCESSGIEVYLVDGFSRQQDYSQESIVDDSIESSALPKGARFLRLVNHQWNAVVIDGKGYLVDCTFGSSVYADAYLRHFYLFSDPHKIGLSHYPEEPKFSFLEGYDFPQLRMLNAPFLHTSFLASADHFLASSKIAIDDDLKSTNSVDIYTDLPKITFLLSQSNQELPFKLVSKPEFPSQESSQDLIGCLSLNKETQRTPTRYSLKFLHEADMPLTVMGSWGQAKLRHLIVYRQSLA